MPAHVECERMDPCHGQLPGELIPGATVAIHLVQQQDARPRAGTRIEGRLEHRTIRHPELDEAHGGRGGWGVIRACGCACSAGNCDTRGTQESCHQPQSRAHVPVDRTPDCNIAASIELPARLTHHCRPGGRTRTDDTWASLDVSWRVYWL